MPDSETSATRSRLRRRARTLGAAALSDAELLALLLGPSHPRADVTALAAALMAECGGLEGVMANSAAVARRAGMAAATDLAVVLETAVRLARTGLGRRPVISSSAALDAYVRTILAARPREAFHVLFLDKKNRLIADERLGDGTVDHAPVYPREVVRRALELGASALVLLHNHPSRSQCIPFNHGYSH